MTGSRPDGPDEGEAVDEVRRQTLDDRPLKAVKTAKGLGRVQPERAPTPTANTNTLLCHSTAGRLTRRPWVVPPCPLPTARVQVGRRRVWRLLQDGTPRRLRGLPRPTWGQSQARSRTSPTWKVSGTLRTRVVDHVQDATVTHLLALRRVGDDRRLDLPPVRGRRLVETPNVVGGQDLR